MGKGREELVDAYTATDYVVRDGDREIVARVGEHCPALDALLTRHHAKSGTFITAWNPRSVPQSRQANDAASAILERVLGDRGYRWLPHDGRSAGWREEGLFVLDLPHEAALAIAAERGQNAVVYGERGRTAVLLFTALMPA